MKRLFSFIWLITFFIGTAQAGPIDDLLGRILPNNGDAAKFSYTVTGGDTQQFTLSCDGSTVTVSGSDDIAVATGINWYLQHYASVDISWNSPTGTLPATLPSCAAETHTASVDWRYYLNFCTYSYSMSFWDWNRWQQELDWMALHGINMPLAITGMECVWKEVLMNTYGYTLDEVNTFVCGSAYYGWFFMNNLTAWGGPQPDSWYTQQKALARQIFQRMKDFGMSPVIPGYVGMIPKDFMTQAEASTITGWAAADIVNGGNWCSFVRPYFVNNTDRLKEFAANYYAAFETLFGDVCSTHFYAIDPFHEGGVPSGVTSASASVTAMWEALTTYDSDAIWVAQHWQSNPTTTLTHAIPRGKLIILDLHGDQYADTSCSGNHTTSSNENHDWVWGQVSNFGGNVGLFGRMDRLINCFYSARDNKATNKLVGIGALPEGIENNSMLYDLLYALPWTTTNYTRTTWIADYVKMRYGLTPSDDAYATVLSAWTLLGAGIYQCPNNNQQGTTESVFLMRPSLTAGKVSSWASSTWYWDFAELRTAFYQMLSVRNSLSSNANYRYDLVDLARQAFADYGKELLDKIKASNAQADKDRFLELILDQDQLLGTRPELRLGRWTAAARALGNTTAEKDLYEKNARMLLTTWGDYAQCESGGLHDYANREWNGLLSSYYYPRWKAFFDNSNTAQSWFNGYEWPFATGASGAISDYLPDGAPYDYAAFSATATGDEITIAKNLYDKYFSDFTPEIWERCDPQPLTVYNLTNASAWQGAADTEGLGLEAPNSDYAGYRVGHSTLTNDKAYQWQFIASGTTEGAYKVQNVKLIELGQAKTYISSTPSSSGYPVFTFSETGTDFYLYRCGDRYYLKEVGQNVYMAPDVRYNPGCVLVSSTRNATAQFHLQPLSEAAFIIVTDVTYGKGNGTFYDSSDNVNTNGFNACKFVSNTTPAVTILASDPAQLNSSDAASGSRLGLNNGTNTFTISVPYGYLIASYSFDCKAVQTAHPARTLTTEGGQELSIPTGDNSTWYTVSETNINKRSTYFTVTTTGWSPLNTRNFIIRVAKDLWSVNFDRNDTYTRTDRKTTYVKLGDETINFTGQSTTPCKIYNDETTQHFTQPVGATVTPTFGFTGNAMMGYVYIDYNNDGDFSDDGELVSRWNDGYQSDQLQKHSYQTPAFTLTTTPGSYRARFKVDWDNTDPGGTGPSGVNNFIGTNGGVVVDVMIDVKDYYEPITNQFYRFHIGDKYMCNVAVDNVRTVTTTNTDASTIFYLDENNYLIAYADGYGFNYGYCKATGTGIFNNFDFLESPTAGSYFIHSNAGTGDGTWSNRYLKINDAGTSLSEGRGQWTIEPVEELPVRISAVKYATLYSPVALTIPDGVTAYIASDEGEYLHLTAIEGGVIPANTGVILYADVNAATTYNFSNANGGSVESNALTGTIAAISRPSGSYILSTGTSGVGFYKDGASTIPGFKAYLPETTLAKGFMGFGFDDVTAVKAIEAHQSPNQVIYDLKGRCIQNPAKGIYIVNDKKVVIK